MRPAGEGVVKYEAVHHEEPLTGERFAELAAAIDAWRELLRRLGLVGQDPARYGGAGFGNLSARVGPPAAPLGRRGFLVSGTGTGGRERLGLAGLSRVEAYDYAANRVESRGPVPPSSESLTHGAAYDLGPHVRAVLHVHSPVLWRAVRRLGLPVSDPRVAYGTPEMAREVLRLHRETVLAERRIFAMGGHEDGLLAFGRSLEEAGLVLITWLGRALALPPPPAPGVRLPRR